MTRRSPGDIGHLQHQAVATTLQVALQGEVADAGGVEREGVGTSGAVEHHHQGCIGVAANHLGANGAHRGGGGDAAAAEGGGTRRIHRDRDRPGGVATEAHTSTGFSHRKFGDVSDVDREALAVGQATIGRFDGDGIGRLAFKVGAGADEEQLGATDLEAGSIGSLKCEDIVVAAGIRVGDAQIADLYTAADDGVLGDGVGREADGGGSLVDVGDVDGEALAVGQAAIG